MRETVTSGCAQKEHKYTHLSFFLSDKPFHSLLLHLHTVLCPCNCGKKRGWPRGTLQAIPKGGWGTRFLKELEREALWDRTSYVSPQAWQAKL